MYYEVVDPNNFEHLAVKLKQEQCSDCFWAYKYETGFYKFSAHFLKADCNNNEDYKKSAAFGENILLKNNEQLRIALWNQVFPVAANLSDGESFIQDSDFPKLSAFLSEAVEYAEKLKNILSEGRFHDNRFVTERLYLAPCVSQYCSMLIEYFRTHRDDLLILYNRAFSEKNIQHIKEMYATDDDNIIRFTVLDKNDGKMVGCVAVMFIGKTAHLEYMIFKEYRRAGYAFEAVNALIFRLFDGDIYRYINSVYKGKFVKIKAVPEIIKAEICHGNGPSENLVKRLGFSFDGADRCAVIKYNEDGLPESQEDKLLYSLCKP